MYEIKDELTLFFFKLMKIYLSSFVSFFCLTNQKSSSDVGRPSRYFQSVRCFQFDFASKNINRVNDYNAMNAFVAKLKLGIVELKKEMQLPFLN